MVPDMGLRRLSVALALTGLLTAACTGGGQPAASHSPSAAPGGAIAAYGGCSAQPPDTALPSWARAGFTPPADPRPHVMGVRGDIVAILWATRNPLHAPPLGNVNNKILWVSRVPLQPMSPLMIRATLAGGGRTVTREVAGGPGPSIIDLPAAGCWTMDLSWSGHTDQVKLRYVAS